MASRQRGDKAETSHNILHTANIILSRGGEYRPSGQSFIPPTLVIHGLTPTTFYAYGGMEWKGIVGWSVEWSQ